MDVSAGAMRVESTRMAVSSNNVANVNTPNFRAGSLNQASLESGGVQATGVRQEPNETPSPPDPKPSTVDLSDEAVRQISASASFDANAETLKTQDEMTGTVLDLLA